MAMTLKLEAGQPMPAITLPRAGGGTVRIGGEGRWQLVVVYRGKHCPLCRRYLKTLDGLLESFQSINTEVIAVSGDPREKAEAEASEEAWRFPVGYDLSPAQMRLYGLYISEPRSAAETDRLFPEPGVFVINPAGLLQIVDISNAPFARPDLQALFNGLSFAQERHYPIRGTADSPP
jgi:peroxiredoxin